MDDESPIKILIVDDDRVDRGLCVRGAFRIRQYGRSSAEANSAQAGIEMAKSLRPDCML